MRLPEHLLRGRHGCEEIIRVLMNPPKMHYILTIANLLSTILRCLTVHYDHEISCVPPRPFICVAVVKVKPN